MSKTLRAGLAWATPVKPDKLLAHVDAYAKVLPVLHALRLAHRFGKGPHAHITKLPVEIELAIEDLIITAERGAYNYVWHDMRCDFACYESECAPSQHYEEEMSPLWDAASDAVTLCATCTAYGVYDGACKEKCDEKTAIRCAKCQVRLGRDDCERTCQAVYEEAVEETAAESDSFLDTHLRSADRWTALISRSQSGELVNVLRTHFGLEAYFAHTYVDRQSATSWPEHRNHKWHGPDERKTTLCYLTLPKQLGPVGSFLPTEMEADLGEYAVAAAQALEIDTDALHITSKQCRRFQKALKVLNLGIRQHPSQMHGVTVSSHQRRADVTTKGATEPTGNWPRLLLLVNSE
ncbi:hypothetical protein LTR53_005588 [Teratosphaeriaceae sp. CCFEE 6253]|nr:hypothetical protein LTR53_005588 [Teratosphaeriaceae sp. CCFEE 6253]